MVAEEGSRALEASSQVRLEIDLDRLGPAALLDAAGRVLRANAACRPWLDRDGTRVQNLPSDSGVQPTELPRWVERSEVGGFVVRAVVTSLPLPGGGALVLFTEVPFTEPVTDVHLRATLDSVPAMIGYWDRNLQNRFANRAYVEWFATSPQEVYGRHIRDLLGSELYAKNLPFMEAALRGEPQYFERTIPKPDGSGVRHSNAAYIPDTADGEVAGFSVLVSDVTALKNAESALKAAGLELEQRVRERTAELEQSNAELARSNAELARSNAELDEFAHVASHDLQEPLRTISSYCELLWERYHDKLDERGERYIRYTVDSAQKMRGSISALLKMSRVGGAASPMLSTSATEAVHSALAAVQAHVDASGASVLVEPLPRVLGDPTQIAEIFQNLLSNALKFRGAAPPEIRVSARRSGDFVEFSVKDNGIGLDPRFAQQIFRVFQRLHGSEAYEGSGIGLSIAKKLVERHGGSIGVHSTPGQGATFWFTLPAAATEPLQ